MTSTEISFKSKTNMNQIALKKPGFTYFCKFMARVLTLRPQNIYIYIFRGSFDFLQILSHFPILLEARIKLIQLFTKF